MSFYLQGEIKKFKFLWINNNILHLLTIHYVPGIVRGTMYILTHFILTAHSARQGLSISILQIRNWGIDRRKLFPVTLLQGDGVLTELQAGWILSPGITHCCLLSFHTVPDLQPGVSPSFNPQDCKIAFSVYKWRYKGSEVKKLAKSIFIIWYRRHFYLTLGWPCNLLSEVRVLLRVKRDIINS